jgi:hypothetical protein
MSSIYRSRTACLCLMGLAILRQARSGGHGRGQDTAASLSRGAAMTRSIQVLMCTLKA